MYKCPSSRHIRNIKIIFVQNRGVTSKNNEAIVQLINVNKAKSGESTPSKSIHNTHPLVAQLKKIGKGNNLQSPKLANNMDKSEIETKENKKTPEDNVAVNQYKSKAIYFDRKIHNGLIQTISVFRDLDTKYKFLRLEPPSTSSAASAEVSRVFWLKFASQTQDRRDLLEAWHLATRLDPDEYQACEADILDRLVHNLGQALPSYTYSELASITFNLSLLRDQRKKLGLLTTMLDTQLTTKMKEKLSGDVTSEVIDECLNVSFLWLRRAMARSGSGDSTKIPVGQLRGLHNTSLVSLLLTDLLPLLNPSQTVFSLFLAGVHRRFPGCHHKYHRGQGFSIPDNLNTSLCSILPDLTHREVGVVCHALHQTDLRLESCHNELRQTLLHTLLTLPDPDIARDDFSVSSIAKILKNRGAENSSHVLNVMAKYEPHMEKLGSYPKLRLLQFVLPGKPSPHESRKFLTSLCWSLQGKLDTMRLKDLEQLAFCLHFLNHDEGNYQIMGDIRSAMLNCDWSNVKSGMSFIYLIGHLARMGCIDVDSFNTVLDAANKCVVNGLENDQEIAAAIDFLFRINNIPLKPGVSTNYVVNYIQWNRFRCIGALFQLLELDCIRELYNLDCVQLDPSIRKVLTEYFHSGSGNMSSHSFEDIMSPSGHILSADFNDQTKKFIHRDLVLVLGGEDHVKSAHAFPHSTSSDLFFAKNKVTGMSEKLPTDFQCYNRDGILDRKGDELEFWAVVVPKKGNMDYRSRHMFGPLAYKISHLTMLGYKVRVIPWFDYYKKLKARQNLMHLRNLLELTRRK